MSATNRENRLLVAENWTKIYQSFRNADFQSYDFENLRRTMINYIRQNYPEDFNDYVESSEYLALIDLIAFLGQNIAFRIDLNARENFLELAERRDSILRLARVISYNAKRNLPAQGLLKITSIQTTETVLDSNGRNLANQVITWNDASNQNWNDQFITVFNASLPTTNLFGNPTDKDTIYGIPTEQYRFQTANTDVPLFAFSKVVSGTSMKFEITSTTFKGEKYIYEEAPKVGNRVACVYRDDGRGSGSANTGFFLNFTQGTTNIGSFNITQPKSNESIDIDTYGINQNDVWLYQLDMNGLESDLWTKVPSLSGNNIVYNSLNHNIRKIYGVTTRARDAISLEFGDGTFGDMPQGPFRLYYRLSNGMSYTINKQDIRNVSITLPYFSSTGQLQQLSLTLSLTTTVSNSSPSESNDSIKTNAQQNYYTNNRMITGEDYNISPLTVSQQILKVKAVNRTSSGISRYFDLRDPTSKYSSTTLYSDDGVIYNELYKGQFTFSYSSRADVETVVYNKVLPLLKTRELRNFFYSEYVRDVLADGLHANWVMTSTDVGRCDGTITVDGTSSASYDISFIKAGALVKFTAPYNKFYDNDSELQTGLAHEFGTSYDIWAEVIAVSTNNVYTLNKKVPSTSRISKIIPNFDTDIGQALVYSVIDKLYSAPDDKFGLSYSGLTNDWAIISNQNIDTLNDFSLVNQGSNLNLNNDTSWLMLFTPYNGSYIITTRESRYVFESDTNIRFYYDGDTKIYNSENSTIVDDTINILSVNVNKSVVESVATGVVGSNIIEVLNPTGITLGMIVQDYAGNTIVPIDTLVIKIQSYGNFVKLTLSNNLLSALIGNITFKNIGSTSFTQDILWKPVAPYIGIDGYVDTKKLVVSFMDTNDNGIADNPEIFNKLIDNTNDKTMRYIIQEKYLISTGQDEYRYFNNANGTVVILPSEPTSLVGLIDGKYYYFIDTDVLKKFTKSTSTLTVSVDYRVFIGRDKLKFKYTHAAGTDYRIDPGVSNLIDIYVLTADYDLSFRQWIYGGVSTKPLPPSTNELYDVLSPSLNLIKSVSDDVIFHPVSYTVLFGDNAAPELQAVFKVIKNPDQVISDNDVKTNIITAINTFFAIENWDFGDTFYFTELSTYVINRLAPAIVSFVIVPIQDDLNFGNLFEINANRDQLFISSATVNNIEIISGITADNVKSTGNLMISTQSQQTISSATYGSL
jgi:hypothetical protein